MLKLLGTLVACLALSAQATEPPLRVGLLPILSPKALITHYQPLRIYLERVLQRPVEMSTAPNFKRFHEATLAGEFDLLMSAAHFTRHAQLEAGFLPLATYLAINRATLITKKNVSVKKIDELRGRNLAVFDPLALIVMQAQQWLEDQRLKAGSDYRIVVSPSQTSVVHSVLIGESLLGVISPSGVRQLSPEMLEQIQIYAELPQVPTLIWAAPPRMTAQAERIQTALLRFGESAEGAQFFGSNAYNGMRAIGAEEMRKLDRSAHEVARLLRQLP